MTPDELLAQLEPLDHDARLRRMIALGREAAGDQGLAATIAALAGGEWYARQLALSSCHGSRDGALVLRALADPSRTLRARAIALVPVVCDDAQVTRALGDAPPRRRRALLRALRARGRQEAIDAYLDAGAAREHEDLAVALPFGSPTLVARHASRALERADATIWRGLARHHPEFTVAALAERAAAATRLEMRLLWLAQATLPALADTAPERALALVMTLLRHIPAARLPLQRLAERQPEAVAALVLARDERASVRFDRVAQRLPLPVLLALVARRPETLPDRGRWFRRLAPAARTAVYARVARGWRDRDGVLERPIVALLAAPERGAEAWRHLALPVLATRPAARLPYAAFLPWADARAALEPALGDPDPAQRGVALATLLQAARYWRDQRPAVLALVRARRHEQDPVRGVLLRGLAELPPGSWHAEHLDDLGGALGEALAAADLSAATAAAAERLVVGLLPFHPAWAAGWLARVVGERGRLGYHAIGDRLSAAGAARVVPALLPVLRAWATREREWNLVLLATSLGRRARPFPDLAALLEGVLRDTRATWTADALLGLVAARWPDRLALLVPALLADDPSWITRPVVHRHLHRHRQELLTPFLGQRAYRGRFSTGKTRYVLPLADGFGRWTPRQQALFAATLGEVIADEVRDIPTVLTAVGQLAALPALRPAALVDLAAAVNPRHAVRDAALWALGACDTDAGLPILLAALGDERGRVAIYALRRALLELPPARALPLLRAAPLERVTIAKEVVRLLGALRVEGAYRDLLALDGRALHRDVRVALLRALWDWPERDATWPILERAASAADPALADGVIRLPADRLSPRAQGRLAGLLARVLAHPAPQVRLVALERCATLPVADPTRALRDPLLVALGSPLPDECAAAARAVFATYAGEDAPLVGAALTRILPQRGALATAVGALQHALHRDRERLLPAARAALSALAADPLTVGLRVGLAADALPVAEFGEFVGRLAADGALHPEALMAAVTAIGVVAGRATTPILAALEASFGASADPGQRRLGLATLVAGADGVDGWDDARLERLRVYRADPANLVASVAQFILPPGDPT